MNKTATFVLHHPEHGHAITHPILSRIIDGTLTYDRNGAPFNSFIALFSQTTEVTIGNGIILNHLFSFS